MIDKYQFEKSSTRRVCTPKNMQKSLHVFRKINKFTLNYLSNFCVPYFTYKGYFTFYAYKNIPSFILLLLMNDDIFLNIIEPYRMHFSLQSQFVTQ